MHLSFNRKYSVLLEKFKTKGKIDVLQARLYPFAGNILKMGQFIGDTYETSRIKAVYKLLADSNVIELPNKEGAGAQIFRVKAKRVDSKEVEIFEGGTVRENFVLLTPKEAKTVISALNKEKEVDYGTN